MAIPAYRRAKSNNVLITVLVLLVVAGNVGLVPLLGPGQMQTWHLGVFMIPMGVAFVVGFVMVRRRHRRQEAGRVRALEAMGFEPMMKPTESQRTELWALVGHLTEALGVRGGAEKVQWIARWKKGARYVWIFETQHVTGSGRYTQVNDRTIVAWPANYPELPGTRLGNAPGFLMMRLPWLERWVSQKNELIDPAFADLEKAWAIFGEARTGRSFLTPETRTELASSPQGESWSLGGGWVCCVFRAKLDGENLKRFYERATRLLMEPR